MPSPLPGVSPYLEQEDAWHDFHERFMPWVADCLAAQVDPRYIVKIDEHIYIHDVFGERRRFLGRADIAVGQSRALRGDRLVARRAADAGRGHASVRLLHLAEPH
jgi:hypothetical protein